jgi:hypothetical protein
LDSQTRHLPRINIDTRGAAIIRAAISFDDFPDDLSLFDDR